jgi:hypothetical protein
MYLLLKHYAKISCEFSKLTDPSFRLRLAPVQGIPFGQLYLIDEVLQPFTAVWKLRPLEYCSFIRF